MSYKTERDRFMIQAANAGLNLDTITKLLRYASTLNRLNEAMCNGDYPYNGDRDRPVMTFRTCDECNGKGHFDVPRPCYTGTTTECFSCQNTGRLQTNGRQRIAFDARYATCPRCETTGVRKSKMVASSERVERENPTAEKYDSRNTSKLAIVKICPYCRTEEKIHAISVKAEIQGDPRGYPITLIAPNGDRMEVPCR